MKVHNKILKAFGALLIAALLFGAMPAQRAAAETDVVYDAIPDPLPPSMASYAYQANQIIELGDYFHLGGTNRELRTVTVTMVTWAYQSNWPTYSDPAGWDHPITLNIYNAVPGTPNQVGSLIETKTDTFTVPWRPEPDTTGVCTDSKWLASDNTCHNGYAFNITFDLSSLNVTLPDDVILGIAFNTQSYGDSPIGIAGPYDSLNIGAEGNVSVGSDNNVDNAFYATHGGEFQEDTGFSPYGTITFRVTAAPEPSTVYVDDDWSTVPEGDDPDGTGPATMMGYDAFATIQAGIDRVIEGGTIFVADGEYVEVGQIVIDKDLSIVGEDKATTIIKPAQDTGSSGDARGWFLIQSGVDFNLSDVTLDGEGKQIYQGIRSWGTGTIDNNIFKNIKYGTYLGSAVVTQANMTFSNNAFTEIGRQGMFVFGSGVNAVVTGNTYTGKGEGDWLDYGVEVGGGATATITDNTITDCLGVASSDGSASAGILATTYYGPGTAATVTNNTLSNNIMGIGIGYDETDTSVVNASGNTFTDNEYHIDATTATNIDIADALANNTFDKAVTIEGGLTIYTSIQEAIDAASDGDTILVGPGTYNEKLVIDVPNLTIQSTDGAAATIIDVPDEAEGEKNTGVKIDGTNLGEIIFDGFTVKDFTENGIVQGMSVHEGTSFYVLNNIVMPKADYLRNGIQVSGDGSVVIGNTVQGAPLTEDWAGSGIMVVNASNVTVQNNSVKGGDIGITVQNYSGVVNNLVIENNTVEEARISLAIYGREGYRDITNITVKNNTFTNDEYVSPGYGVNIQDADISGLTVNENLIKNVSYGFRISNSSAAVVGPVTLRHNQFVYNYYHLLYYNDPSTVNIDAEENWWDSVSGPAESGFGSIYTGTTGLVDYVPWCGDAECSFLVYPLEGEITDTVVINEPVVYLLKDGTVIDTGGACFDIQSDNVTIMTERPGGAVCYPGSPGIQVASGASNIVIEGLEIDGQGTAVGNGIDFLGAVNDVIISDTFIHDMDGNGVNFAATPGEYVEITGNLFKDNTGVGVEAPADLDVRYNSWGAYGGPTAGDGVSTNITNYTPWTHVDVCVDGGDTTRYLDEVALGDDPAEQITYDVFANLQETLGAQFTLTFDPAKLQVVSTDTTGTVFPYEWTDGTTETVTPGVAFDNTTGKITFAGGSMSPVSGLDQFLFSVTFEGVAPTDVANSLFFDEADLDLFGMNPGYGASLNIYADELVGIEDVNVYDLPILAIVPLETFAVGNPKEFTLTVTNPATGRSYTDLNVDLDVPIGATLEYWDGGAWVTYVDGVDVGALAVNAAADVLFRITFDTDGDIDIPVTLNDGTIFLVEDTFTFTVLEAYTVTGSIQMQGRTERSGVLVEFLNESLSEYTYDTLSTNVITGNFSLLNVANGTYSIFMTHDRYLDFNYTGYSLTADVLDLERLELRGGDVAKDNAIDISDASVIGANYGATGDNSGDANFDGSVNIQDLAMVGGNYGLNSTTAYDTWLTP